MHRKLIAFAAIAAILSIMKAENGSALTATGSEKVVHQSETYNKASNEANYINSQLQSRDMDM